MTSILIDATIENAERVLRALSALPFGGAGDIDRHDLVQQPVTMIGDTPNVDVLTRAWNLTWHETERGIAVFDVESVRTPTVSLQHLIQSKCTGRTQDAADIEVLEALRRMRGYVGE